MSYTRDISNDLIYNSSTGEYEPASSPIQILVDASGKVIMYNGKALKIDNEAVFTNPSILTDSSSNAYTYNGNAILINISGVNLDDYSFTLSQDNKIAYLETYTGEDIDVIVPRGMNQR